MCGCVRAME